MARPGITEFVTIPKFVYNNLLKQEEVLVALHNAGVDNWEFYEDALSQVNFDETEEEDEGSQEKDDSPDGNWLDKEGSW